MGQTHKLWVEKYRPQTVDQYVFQNKQHEAAVRTMIADQSIPHLLLAGVQGTGKTSLAKLLIRAMNLDESDVIEINASDERGIDTFRAKVKNFAMSTALSRFKIVHLEEADKLTPDAQAALKRFMEEVSDYVRFILTTNHLNKIIPPIQSRCQTFEFRTADPIDITESMATILVKEGIKFDLNTLDKYVAIGYPDVRKIINTLQQNCVGGELQSVAVSDQSGDWKLALLSALEAGKWIEARKLVCANVTSDDWENVYRFMYENINRSPSFQQREKWEEAIVVIAEHLYKHSIVSDPEINAAAMFIRISQL